MDQIKIGKFFQELRKEKGFTQEQLAERLGVARRTISRSISAYHWLEKGNKKKMDKELEQTVLKVAEYSNDGKKRLTKTVCVYFILGILALIANALMNFMELEDTFWTGFANGITFGIALGAMILGLLYVTGVMQKVQAFKMRLIGKDIQE